MLEWDDFIEKPSLYQKTKFLIVDNKNDSKVRAVCAVAMGCGMWPRVIKSCGPSNIKKHLDELT